MNHIKLLEKHGACNDAVEWASQYPDLATAWDNCQRPDWMLWLHDEGIIQISARDLRLFACECVRYTPIGDGRTVWDLLTDERSRNAVEVSERYANGEATDDELCLAKVAGWAAAGAAAGVTGAAAKAAAWAAARDAARDAARAAARDAESAAVWGAAQAFQADLLRKRIGNPFKAMEAQP